MVARYRAVQYCGDVHGNSSSLILRMALGFWEGSSGRPRARRTLSVNDAPVPFKSRMYSAWYRFRYG